MRVLFVSGHTLVIDLSVKLCLYLWDQSIDVASC